MLHELAHLLDAAVGLDLLQHVQAGFVGATVGRAPQAGYASRDGSEGVGARRTAQTHGGSRSVLLVVSVQDEDAVQRALDHRVHLVLFARIAEHHAHEVACIRQIVLGVHVGLAHTVLVCHGNQRRHLGDQADRSDFAVLWVMDVGAVMVESRHAAHQTGQHSHGVCIAAEATQEELHLLVDHGVLGHALFEFRLLRCVRQFTVQQQVAGFQEVAVLGQLFDGITTVQQLTLVAVDVGDGGLAGGCGEEAGVISKHARLAVQLADIDHVWTDSALVHRQLNARSSVAE